ncbi:MAG: dienelactone hydrolase family protein, partial [Hyphococcus sp.]
MSVIRKYGFGLLAVVIALAAIAYWKREPLMLAWLAGQTEASSFDERLALIRSGAEIRLPAEGSPPYPVVLQFHGCAGIRPPFHDQWADVANDAGFAAVIVDSNGPRGFSRQKALEVICKGDALLGQERAGDVLAALTMVKNDTRLDADRTILAGWSHGAWTVMDFLTMDPPKRGPAGLKGGLPAAPKPAGAILFYPHCGLGALSRFRRWTTTPPTLAFVAGADEMVDAEACLSYFTKRREENGAISVVYYDDAHHVFDDPFLEPDWIHWYNEQYAADAANKY